MKFPGLTTIRKADPDDSGVLELSAGQAEARLSKQIQNDKQRSLVKNNQAIKRAEACIRRTQDKVLKAELRQKIDRLEKENTETKRFLD